MEVIIVVLIRKLQKEVMCLDGPGFSKRPRSQCQVEVESTKFTWTCLLTKSNDLFYFHLYSSLVSFLLSLRFYFFPRSLRRDLCPWKECRAPRCPPPGRHQPLRVDHALLGPGDGYRAFPVISPSYA